MTERRFSADGGEEGVAIGDLNSGARGSGARKNAGKPQWWHLPVWALEKIPRAHAALVEDLGKDGRTRPELGDLFYNLGRWQQGVDDGLNGAIAVTLWLMADEQSLGIGFGAPMLALQEVVRVLEFGAKKYKVGNWAKGMPWSVCFSCALSHALKYASNPAASDEESGLSHLAHLMCNLLFLKAYETHWTEGDDRIKEFRLPALTSTIDPADDRQLWGDVPIIGDFA